jgi:hypothetical protein
MTTLFNDLLDEGSSPQAPQIAPFFFLNHNLEAQRLRWHVEQMREAGFDGFFMHAREGLQTPYLSQAWFDAIDVCVQRAAELGMKAWLYDEMPYPSGAAGGEVVRRRPGFIEQSLKIRTCCVEGGQTFDWELGEREILAAFARCKSNPRLNPLDLTSCIGPVADTWIQTDWDSRWYYPKGLTERFKCPRTICVLPKNHLRVELPPGYWEIAVVENQRGGDELEPFGHYVDVSNPDATELFIALTHERYRTRFAGHFGTTIPGIFFDEPKFRSALPWGYGIAKEIGSLSANLVFALAGKAGVASETERRKYRKCLDRTFHTGWLEPVKNWCSAHGLALAGHISPEEDWWFESRQTGSILKKLRELNLPGCDLIIPAVGNRRNPVLNLTVGLAVSAAAQSGRGYALCELFAASGHRLDLPTMHRIAAWLACHGINFLVPHGWFYSLDGYRKFDAPPSFAPPGYEPAHLRQWADEFRRIAHGPASSADFLVIRPIDYLRGLSDSCKARADELLADAAHLATEMLMRGLTLHWADDDELAELRVSGDELIFKGCRYGALIYFEGFVTRDCRQQIQRCRSGSRMMTASKARREALPRYQSTGEIAGRQLGKDWLLVNLGKKSASATIGRSSIRLLAGEIFQGQVEVASVPRKNPEKKPCATPLSAWKLEWPQHCKFTPPEWTLNGGKAVFGPCFEISPGDIGVRGRTVFGDVPIVDKLEVRREAAYETVFHAERIRNLGVRVEGGNMRGQWKATLNGHALNRWKAGSDFLLVHEIAGLIQPGKNILRFIFTILRRSEGMLAPCQLAGCFALDAKGAMIPPPGKVVSMPLNPGFTLPSFEGPLRWHSGFIWKGPGISRACLRLQKAPRDAVGFMVNGHQTPALQNVKRVIDITKYLKPGRNDIVYLEYGQKDQQIKSPPEAELHFPDGIIRTRR